NQHGRERTRAIPGHRDRDRPLLGHHRLRARPVAVIGGVVGFLAARRIAEMMAELTAEHPLDERLLQPARRRVDVLHRHPHGGAELVQNLVSDGREPLKSASLLCVSWGLLMLAPHTKFQTRSWFPPSLLWQGESLSDSTSALECVLAK